MVLMMDDAKSPNEKPLVKPVSSLSPEERLAIWRHAQEVLKDYAKGMLAELEQSRAEWNR
jgi:hypothetical protein